MAFSAGPTSWKAESRRSRAEGFFYDDFYFDFDFYFVVDGVTVNVWVGDFFVKGVGLGYWVGDLAIAFVGLGEGLIVGLGCWTVCTGCTGGWTGCVAPFLSSSESKI